MRAAENVSELLACIPHGWRVDERQKTLGIARKHAIEQRTVTILQRSQHHVPLEVVVPPHNLLENPLDLLIQSLDCRR